MPADPPEPVTPVSSSSVSSPVSLSANETPPRTPTRLRELAWLFFRLGTTAFGGPAAHIAMMEEEVVRRRRWLSAEEFLELIAAANLIPGPNSTELAIHIGHRRAGQAGLLVAGTCFIVPAAVLSFAFAWAYVRFGTLPVATGLLHAVKPVIVVVVAQAIVSLASKSLDTPRAKLLVLGATVLAALRLPELVVLGVAGLVWVMIAPSPPASAAPSSDPQERPGPLPLVMIPSTVSVAVAALPPAASIFLVFAKIGSVLYGSGYVLLAFLRSELVVSRGWLSEGQLLDAVAVGQVTPGPVFSTATFVGYLIGGAPGSLAATFGIFLPAFVFVALSAVILPKIRRSRRATAFLAGVSAASLSLMVVVSFDLGRAALVDAFAWALAAFSAVLLFRFRVSSSWLVVGAAALGVLYQSWFP